MKVIERKTPTPPWPRFYDCLQCRSKLQVEAADITQPGQRDGEEGWFHCPVCGFANHVDVEDTRSASLTTRIATNEATSPYGQRGPE